MEMDVRTMDFVRLEQSDRVATITLAKAGKGNALCLPMIEELIAVFKSAQTSRLIVFRGEGKHFCTGLDLSGLIEETDATLLQRFVRIEHLRAAIEASPVQTVAIGVGSTYGAGADIFAACDHRLAASGTRFAFPGVAFGIILGTARLAALIGSGRARDILDARRIVSAEDALRDGLVTEITDREILDDRLEELADNAARLDRAVSAALRGMTRQDRSDADLAALVRSASEPGLKARIEHYRSSLVK